MQNMKVTEIATTEAQLEENQNEQQDDRFQVMNNRFETMEKQIKSLTDLVGLNVSIMTRIMKRGEKRSEHMLSTKISPSHQRSTR